MARLRLRSDLALLLTCVGLYIGAAAQVRTPRGTALAVGITALAAPGLAAADAVSRTWDDYVAGRINLTATLAELQRLRQETAELKQTNQLLAAELAALRQGSQLLASLPKLPERAVLARVISRDVLLTRSLRLDRGQTSGVQVDSPVLAEGGVLGRVDLVAADSCRVQLLSHPAAAAAARLATMDVEGLLIGGERPSLTGLPPYTTVTPGTPVVTTGSEGIYPPGLLLGTAEEARTEGLFTVVPVHLAVRPSAVMVALILPPAAGAAR